MAINVNIGTLDKRISIKRLEQYRDEHGLTKQRMVTVANTWARIEPLRGHQLMQADKETITDQVQFTIRYRDNVDNTCFLEYGGTTYNIRNVLDPYMAHVKLEIVCTIRTVGNVTR